MDELQKAERIDQLIREGLKGRTPRHIRTDKGVSLEGKAQAEYFADIRRGFDTYAGSRVMKVDKNKDAALLYKELFGTQGNSVSEKHEEEQLVRNRNYRKTILFLSLE